MGQSAAGARSEAETERGEARSQIAQAQAELHKLDESAAAMKPPEFQEAPEAPKPVHTDPWQTFGSPAMILAAFSGFLTQAPLVTALNAGAKVMQSISAGDAAANQRQMDIWKVAVDNASKANQFELDQYRAAIEKLGTDRADARAQLTAAMSALGDARGLDVLAMDDDKTLLGYLQDKERLGVQLKTALPQVQAWNSFIQGKIAENGNKPLNSQQTMDALKEFQTASMVGASVPKMQAQSAAIRAEANTLPESDPRKAQLQQQADDIDAAIAQEKSKSLPMMLTPDAAKFTAERILAGDPTATVGLARSAGAIAQVDNAVTALAKERGVDAARLMAAKFAIKADSTSLSSLTKMTDAAVAFEKTAEQNFEYARSIRPADPNLGPWLNRWIMDGETMFGDPDVPAYVAAVMTGANEYAKIMAGSTGAQGSTVDSRREAAQLFSPYLNSGQIDKVIQVARQDMGNRESSLYGQIGIIKQRIRGDSAGASMPEPSIAPPSSAGATGIPDWAK